MSQTKEGDILRKEILQSSAEYCRTVHMRETPFIPGVSRVPYAGRIFDEQELVNLVDASLDFWLTHGCYADEFEKKLRGYLNVKSAFAVNSGSSANLLAFMSLTSDSLGVRRIKRGDEIITVAAGFPTTVAPIIQYGAVPVFVDIDLETLNLMPDALGAALSPKTKAVFAAHSMGNPFDLDKVTGFCRDNNLWLIEDNCDALGATYKNRYTGTFGDVGTSSFYPAHHITMGEGGAVYTNSELLGKIVLSLRDWGRDCCCPSGKDNTCGARFSRQFGDLPFGYDHKYVYSNFGYNLKITEMQGAVGCAQMGKLNDFIAARRKNHQFFSEALAPLADRFILPKAQPHSEPSWFGFFLSVKQDAGFTRDDIVKHMEAANIQTRPLFAGNIIKHPCFDSLRNAPQTHRVIGDLTNTDFAMNNGFWFGVYPGMSEEMLCYIVDEIFKFVKTR